MTDRGRKPDFVGNKAGLDRKLTFDPREAARLRKAARAAWRPVLQPHPDDRDYLKAKLSAHGISRIPEAEPPTASRLKRLLRRAGVKDLSGLWGMKEVAGRQVNLTAEDFIARNPNMPLWVATAVSLETIEEEISK